MTWRQKWVVGALWVALGGVCSVAWAQPAASAAAAEPMLAADLREEIVRLPVTVKDLYNREETRSMAVTVFRPQGDGPHPLVIMNHGRATADKRAQQGRSRFEHLARYLVNRGFVVMLPTRVGYWETYGDFDPENSGSCSNPRLDVVSKVVSDQVLATLAYARTRPEVDTSRWLVMGQSVGGVTTVATTWRKPAGLVGAVNFSGGAGGDPVKRPGDPCSPQAIARLWGAQAAGVKTPMLWLYWANDLYWGAEHPRTWHQAWVQGGGVAEFHQLAPSGTDGHNGANADMDHWVPLMDAYLQRLGFPAATWPRIPPARTDVAVTDVDRVPLSASARAGAYQKFLEGKGRRAFAIGADGAWGWATGDWAVGRALGFCQVRRGQPCKLYAVDDQVVWAP